MLKLFNYIMASMAYGFIIFGILLVLAVYFFA